MKRTYSWTIWTGNYDGMMIIIFTRPRVEFSIYTIVMPRREAGVLLWCRISDVFQTITLDAVDTYKFVALVQQFNLADDLLDSAQ